jgi:hypothetical protein
VSPAFAQAHVRRLEAIRRRISGVERAPDGSWSVPADYAALAARYEAIRTRERPVEVELLSPVPLERLAGQDGATWLDRQLASGDGLPRDAGFGREVRSALALRRAWLLDQGLASIEGEAISFRADLLDVLQRRELLRVGTSLSRETGLEFVEVREGARVEGLVRRRIDLASGRFALIETGREFTLVPWRPVLERAIGREVAGRVGSGGISWTIGRKRGLEV